MMEGNLSLYSLGRKCIQGILTLFPSHLFPSHPSSLSISPPFSSLFPQSTRSSDTMCPPSIPPPEAPNPPRQSTTTVGEFVLTHLTFSNGNTNFAIICSTCRVAVRLRDLKMHLDAEGLPHQVLEQDTRQNIFRQVIEWCRFDAPEFEKARLPGFWASSPTSISTKDIPATTARTRTNDTWQGPRERCGTTSTKYTQAARPTKPHPVCTCNTWVRMHAVRDGFASVSLPIAMPPTSLAPPNQEKEGASL